MTNSDKYIAARSLLEEAIEVLESTEVGLDKALYKKIETIIEHIGGCMLLISTELIEQ